MKKVLIIAPHLDDEILGCGATIARHVENGDIVHVCVVAHRVYEHVYDADKANIEKAHSLSAKNTLGYQEIEYLDLPDERLDSCLQDIIIPLEKYFLSICPEIVYVPFYGDNNQDHRAVFHAARVVLRPAACPQLSSVFMYETPSSTEQSLPFAENFFTPNHYVDIEKYLDIKLTALQCYETEKRNFPHPRSSEAIRILSQKRGTEIGFSAAEAFMVLRNKWC